MFSKSIQPDQTKQNTGNNTFSAKFEVTKHNTVMTKAITPNFLFYISLLNAKETNKKFPSRNEVAFLGDSGASISVLNLSKHTMISRLGFFCWYSKRLQNC